MNWPPVKAWTSKLSIEGQIHFVAINYGGKLLERWVILMSVIDSSLVLKVRWSKLIDPLNWEPGWDETKFSKCSKLLDIKAGKRDFIFIEDVVDIWFKSIFNKNVINQTFNLGSGKAFKAISWSISDTTPGKSQFSGSTKLN